ncbi:MULTISPECIES: DUF5518 domain-containing protein [Haloferax]|uniref:DUF5518 domain-containing protein n=1 Tax=Haloferax massiliensis TaxID=1476858 RepID=A0A0D6JUK7_9EURY|nr:MULTISPECIES: DUF5518 domain-containing protein [Haloferax]MDS0241651.1 DUF5518 domain-containing protein [Haloferax sp. S2CR25]MDS0444772.1 DUF5518 domain-containing protein [Haloferax sp. S2CR25-2]CQR52339.1 hypothetical protein BN996_03105 [Haloferax massiliensis]
MVSIPRFSALSPAWNAALVGAIASIPVSTLVNWLPDSEATVGAGVMLFGGFIAGAVAAVRSVDSDAAGLRAGFLGGGLELLIFAVTTAPTAAWPLSRVAFFAVAGGAILCLAPLFGLGCGRIGGWVVQTIASRRNLPVNTS